MHRTVFVGQAHPKTYTKKFKSYNSPKVGVHISDQIARNDTCKRATRRWPLVIFFKIIRVYCACVNAYIISFKVTSQRLIRRNFLL